MPHKLTFPSLLSLTVVLFTFLFFSTIQSFLGEASIPLKRQFNNPFSNSAKGEDLSAPWEAAKRLVNNEPSKNMVRRDFLPEGLVFLSPFTRLGVPAAYRLYILGTFFGLWLIFVLASGAIAAGNSFFYFFFFPVIVLLSRPGLNLFERANLDALGALFVYLAFLGLIKKRFHSVVLFLAMASCVKVFYFPLGLVIAVLPGRRKHIVIYLLVHVVTLLWIWLVKGNPALITESLASLQVLILSAPWGTVSVVIASLLALGLYGFRHLRSPADQGESLWLLFALVTYVTALWQSSEGPSSLLIVLLLTPLADKLYRESPSPMVKGFVLVHFALLGASFVPPEVTLPLVSRFSGSYLLIDSFIVAALLLLNRALPASPYQDQGQLPVQSLVFRCHSRLPRLQFLR
jgi:hypothetical protein